MEDIERDWDKPVAEAGILAKSQRDRTRRHARSRRGHRKFPCPRNDAPHRLSAHGDAWRRQSVNLTDIEASCTDGKDRITEVIDLPTTGVNTEHIWLLEHFADLVQREPRQRIDVPQPIRRVQKGLCSISTSVMRRRCRLTCRSVFANVQKAEQNQEGSDDPVLDALEMVTERAEVTDTTAQPLHLRDIEAASEQHNRGEREAEREAERETKRETAGTANVTSSESTTKKARKNRNHKPPKGQYAEHFDHVGRKKRTEIARHHRSPSPRTTRHDRTTQTLVFAGVRGIRLGLRLRILRVPAWWQSLRHDRRVHRRGDGPLAAPPLFARHLNQFFVTFVCVAVAALACTGTLRSLVFSSPSHCSMIRLTWCHAVCDSWIPADYGWT